MLDRWKVGIITTISTALEVVGHKLESEEKDSILHFRRTVIALLGYGDLIFDQHISDERLPYYIERCRSMLKKGEYISDDLEIDDELEAEVQKLERGLMQRIRAKQYLRDMLEQVDSDDSINTTSLEFQMNTILSALTASDDARSALLELHKDQYVRQIEDMRDPVRLLGFIRKEMEDDYRIALNRHREEFLLSYREGQLGRWSRIGFVIVRHLDAIKEQLQPDREINSWSDLVNYIVDKIEEELG